jgi:hypothetical protein
MQYSKQNHSLRIVFPTFVTNGEIKFTCVFNNCNNFNIEFEKVSSLNLSTEALQKGIWKVNVNWSDGKDEYFTEHDFFL